MPYTLTKRHKLFVMALFYILFPCYVFANTEASIGAWNVECIDTSNKKKQCVANQIVTSGGTKSQTILGLMVGYNVEHSLAHVIIRFSSQANKDKGAAVKVDQYQPLRVPIERCDNKICQVRSLIPKGLLEQMKSGKFLRFAFYHNDKQVVYPVVLEGFDKAFNLVIGNKE